MDQLDKNKSEIIGDDEESKIAQETDGDNDENFDRIKKLVEKTADMQVAAKEHHKVADEYFKTLRQKLDASSAFLRTAKNDIENIKFLFQRDHLNNMNSQIYLDNIDKTDEEIDDEMKKVQERLDSLHARVQTLKQQTKTETKSFEESINHTIVTLDNIGKGVYHAENNE